MAEVQIKRISHRHDAILEYMIANPTARLGDVAAHFNVTQAWLSVIINSDVFRAKHEARGDEFFGAAIVPLRERIVGVASQAVEKIAEKMEHSTDGDFALNVADKLLHRLGYAPARTPPTAPGNVTNIQQNYSVSPEVLAKARANFGNSAPQGAVGTLPCSNGAVGEVNGETNDEQLLSPTPEIQTRELSRVGSTLPGDASVHPGDAAEREARTGVTVSGEVLPASE